MQTKKRSRLGAWFGLCPARHVILLLSAAVIAAYFALRRNAEIMLWVYEHIVRPYHRAASALCSGVKFSVAGVLIAAAVLGAAAYIVYCAVRLVRGVERGKTAYRLAAFIVTAPAAVYAGFCILWGVYYYASDFETLSGISAQPVSTEQLETVTKYFARLANEYALEVRRDESGLYCEDETAIFDESASLYGEIEKEMPFLMSRGLRAKPFMFSRAMSYINFTGFFFPFTGEANINTDSPACMMPSTIAHELAHQRGVAPEDEANFVAVRALLAGGSAAYRYSACLLAYIHLGNALYSADYDAWHAVYDSLNEQVRADLSDNNRYWEQFETPVSEVSDKVYTGFLQSYGQSLGLKSYGACVDLLVAYYYDEAAGE